MTDLEDRVATLENALKAISDGDMPFLMTTKQVVKFLQISENRFHEWKREGIFDVPEIRWSERSIRYEREDVLAWARDHKVVR